MRSAVSIGFANMNYLDRTLESFDPVLARRAAGASNLGPLRVHDWPRGPGAGRNFVSMGLMSGQAQPPELGFCVMSCYWALFTEYIGWRRTGIPRPLVLLTPASVGGPRVPKFAQAAQPPRPKPITAKARASVARFSGQCRRG